jgi:phosphate:Na+ symporter
MVKLGFTRAYGTSLRKFITAGTKNRFVACASGIGVTAMVQSSTATALLLISFVKKNAIPLAMALAVVIGSDISTTLVAQVLTLNLTWLSPAFLIIGIVGHMRNDHAGRKRHIFRAMIGVGLMMLSLSLIKQASAPLAGSETLPLILGPLERDPITAILFAAILTYIMHSSLAAVLLFASLATNNIIDLQLGALLVLGANLGGAFIAFIVTYKDGITARRITTGNIIMRCFMVFVFWLAMEPVIGLLTRLDVNTAHHMVNLHTAFNVTLAIFFLPLVQWVAKIIEKIIPDVKDTNIPLHRPLYLDDKDLGAPVVALAAAARETLRMAEMVEQMLEQTIESFKQNNTALAKSIIQKDNDVDKLYKEIKIYLTKLTQESLDPKEADRHLQIITFATNLEYVGDIIDKSLMALAKTKTEKQERFSDEGWSEIKDFHGQVLDNMKLAQTIFLSEDPMLAQKLVDNKKVIREAEQETSALHFDRLRGGLPETIATSSLHLDIIRDYRRINSYITSVAYAILENAQTYDQLRHKKEYRRKQREEKKNLKQPSIS